MENLYLKDEDKGKFFTASSYDGEEVKGELFHANGNHFLLVDGNYAIKVVPQTIKEFIPGESKDTLAVEMRKLSESSRDKVVSEVYQKSLEQIRSDASNGKSYSRLEVSKDIVDSVANILKNEGFVGKIQIPVRDDVAVMLVYWK